jgi:hypothetical protein
VDQQGASDGSRVALQRCPAIGHSLPILFVLILS